MVVVRLLVVPIGSKVRSVFRSAARLDHRVVVILVVEDDVQSLVVAVVRLLLVPVGGEVRPLGFCSLASYDVQLLVVVHLPLDLVAVLLCRVAN